MGLTREKASNDWNQLIDNKASYAGRFKHGAVVELDVTSYINCPEFSRRKITSFISHHSFTAKQRMLSW